MIPYTLLIIFILYMAFLLQGKENRDLFVKIAFLALFVIYGFRNALLIGIDSSKGGLYYPDYLQINNSVISGKNLAFFYMMKVVHWISGGNYQAYITISAGIVMYSYYRIVKKYSVSPLISIMWLLGMNFYFFFFSALKQALAMAILCFALDAMMEEKEWKFYIIVIAASLFHMPALIFLPAYRISKIQFGRAYLKILAALFIFVYLFRGRILQLMVDTYESHEIIVTDNVRFIGGKVIGMVIVIIVAYIVRPPSKNDKLYSTLLTYMGIATVIQTFCYYNNVFERLADYYYSFSILFIPLIFAEKNGTEIQISAEESQSLRAAIMPAIPIIILFCIWRYYVYLNSYSTYFLPYSFFWQM